MLWPDALENTGRQADRQADGQLDRQATDSQTDRQADRQTERKQAFTSPTHVWVGVVARGDGRYHS